MRNWIIYLVAVLMVFFATNVYAQECGDSCGEIVPVETSSEVYDTEITNDSGNVVYIITNGGDVSGITIGESGNDVGSEEEQAEPIKPQVEYGTVNDSWWTGVVIMNPNNETKTGILKLNSQFFNITVQPGEPLTFSLEEWAPNNGTERFTISLWSEDLYLDVLLGRK